LIQMVCTFLEGLNGVEFGQIFFDCKKKIINA
jgi:hypothetical protein